MMSIEMERLALTTTTMESTDRFSRLGSVCLLLVFCESVQAEQTPNEFRPYVIGNVVVDDNLLKLDKGIQSPASVQGKERSEQIYQFGVGIEVLWIKRLHQLTFYAQYLRHRYQSYQVFDHNSQNLGVQWRWKATKRSTVLADYQYKERLASFIDNRDKALQGGLLRSQKGSFQFAYALTQTVKQEVRLEQLQVDYLKTNDKNSNREDAVLDLKTSYLTALENELGGQLVLTQTVYPGRNYQATSTVDDAFNKYSLLGFVKWRPLPKSQLKLSLGWDVIQNAHLTQKDFSDWQGELILDWQLKERLDLRMKLWHRVSPTESVTATYQKSEGVQIQPTWVLTSKINVSLGVQYEEVDYGGASLTSVSNQQKDKLYKTEVKGRYQWSRSLSLLAGYTSQQRDSNVILNDFIDNQFTLTVKAQW